MRRIIVEVPSNCSNCPFQMGRYGNGYVCLAFGKDKNGIKPLKACRDAEVKEE